MFRRYAVEELDWLETMASDAESWVEQANSLATKNASLEDVQKCVKQYGKINLLSSQVDGLRERATAVCPPIHHHLTRSLMAVSLRTLAPSFHSCSGTLPYVTDLAVPGRVPRGSRRCARSSKSRMSSSVLSPSSSRLMATRSTACAANRTTANGP